MAIKKSAPKTPRIKSSLDFTKTRIDHIAVWITRLFGTMLFLVGCILFFTAWICWNLNFIPGLQPFDPFPFPVLQMTVSLFAIILSVSVLINQNRQRRIDKVTHDVEFEVNVRAESEITKMLNMLHEIHLHLGLESKRDRELEEMKAQTDIKQIHQALEEGQEGI